MPLTAIQKRILKTIAANRSQDSYLAGATILHRLDDSPRFSQDLDLFHDLESKVAECAEQDSATLVEAGYRLEWLLRTPAFHRAVISNDTEKVRIEWAQDSAFRFFPLQEDPLCGFRLHDADAATNKMLALAGRQEVRDFVDIMHLNDTYLSLGAMAWAACGKDPGYTPLFLLNHVARHTAYRQEDIDRLGLNAPLNLQDMKQRWIQALDAAQQLVNSLPPDEIGCLYLDRQQQPTSPNPESDSFPLLSRHLGGMGGAWPKFIDEHITIGE
jgi:hypothetical protein